MYHNEALFLISVCTKHTCTGVVGQWFTGASDTSIPKQSAGLSPCCSPPLCLGEQQQTAQTFRPLLRARTAGWSWGSWLIPATAATWRVNQLMQSALSLPLFSSVTVFQRKQINLEKRKGGNVLICRTHPMSLMVTARCLSYWP